MAENLTDFMAEMEKTPPPSFTAPAFHYGVKEDSLLFYFRGDESYARRINKTITLFLSFEDNGLVGCQVKGLRKTLEKDAILSITIENESRLQLGLFFHLLAYEVSEPESVDSLVQLGQRAKGIWVETNAPLVSPSNSL